MEEVRVATEADLDELVRLAVLARDELGVERGGLMWQLLHGRPEPLPATFAADLAEAASDSGVVLLGLFAGVPAGYAHAHREQLGDGTAIAVVSDVYVEAGFRAVGLGGALMEELMAWATAHGCRGIDALVLPGMRNSKNYFERFGLTARAILVHKDLGGAP
ncbi:GNAT family N-acetyltransferase [Iamia sp. SCSIO 61187]|uniref:GNAT family N-acetyltransferase n=1 Tax=Iamia sp. SCSIO 61187 TaxID=2722752 RepID=UPI001C62D023|nr:GNAT family N-acetyltransferase [Iamia sp. SCSIO 61187]QYG92935.1 GNAT family N-acetyltransferase [Iamia sp. SCSIO 61187]